MNQMVTPPLTAAEEDVARRATLSERLDLIARLARRSFHAPIVLISVLDKAGLRLAACQGLPISALGREMGLDRRTLAHGGPLMIPDMREDPRFNNHPFVTGRPFVRFYAGCLVLDAGGEVAGVLSICDREPAALAEGDLVQLRDFARLVESEMQLDSLARRHDVMAVEHERMRRTALMDPSTQLWNRHAMFELLDREFHRTKRSREHVSVIVTALSGFDDVAASKGEHALANAMSEMAGLIRAVVRRSDTVSRFSASECMVFLGRCRTDAAVALAERMLHRAQSIQIDMRGKPVPLRISIGVASAGPDVDWTPDSLVRRAAEALEAAELTGGACVVAR